MRTPLGRVGLGLDSTGAAGIGFWVDPRARRRGVATGAVRAACRWAFATLDVEIIEWQCELGNVASRRVAEKAGFLIEATLCKRLFHREREPMRGAALSSGRRPPERPARRPALRFHGVWSAVREQRFTVRGQAGIEVREQMAAGEAGRSG